MEFTNCTPTGVLPVPNGEGMFKMTFLVGYWELEGILADLGFSAKLFFFTIVFQKKSFRKKLWTIELFFFWVEMQTLGFDGFSWFSKSVSLMTLITGLWRLDISTFCFVFCNVTRKQKTTQAHCYHWYWPSWYCLYDFNAVASTSHGFPHFGPEPSL